MKTQGSVLAGFVGVLLIAIAAIGLMFVVMPQEADAACAGDNACNYNCREQAPCQDTINSRRCCTVEDDICNTCTCTPPLDSRACSCQ